MAGLVSLADFFGWNAQEAIEAYVFRSDVQDALNREPGAEDCTRTLERYQKLFREDDLAARVFEEVTARLVQALDLDVSRQRLDSTHVFSHMASFGRTAHGRGDQRFLTQLQRPDPDASAALPEDLRSATCRRQRGSAPTPRTLRPAHAAVSKPPRTSTSSSPASPAAPTLRTDRPIRL